MHVNYNKNTFTK